MASSSATGTPRGVRPPPPGVVPNFNNPENQTSENIALHTIMLTFSTAALIIRLYTRSCITHQLGLDDLLCSVGYVFICAFSGLLLAAVLQRFIGYHIWEVQLADYIKGARFELVARFTYYVAAAFVKLSCMVFYRRFLARSPVAKYLCNGGIAFIVSGYLAFFLMSVFACIPVAKRFNANIPGTCLDPNVGAYGSGALNIVTDVFVVLFPLPIIWGLRMSLGKRLKAMTVFALGFVVIAMSITRTALTSLVFTKLDGTWELSKFDIYPVIELNIGLICACFLTFPAFLDRFGPRAWSLRSSRSTSDQATPQTAISMEERSSRHSWTSEETSHADRDVNPKDTGITSEVYDLERDTTDRRGRLESMESTSTLRNNSVSMSKTVVQSRT